MKLKSNSLKTKNQNRKDYKTINGILILIFVIGATYLVCFKEPFNCYYKENFNIACKTCGLTRDLKSIMKLDFSNLINPISVYYFISLTLVFVSRFFSQGMLRKDIEIKNVLIFDIAIGIIVIGIITTAKIV